MTKRTAPECRFTMPSGRYCRKLAVHRRHSDHVDDCRVPPADHHDFVEPNPYGRRGKQATIRTTIFLSIENRAYARRNGGITVCINRLLTIARAVDNNQPLRIRSIEDAEPVAPTATEPHEDELIL